MDDSGVSWHLTCFHGPQYFLQDIYLRVTIKIFFLFPDILQLLKYGFFYVYGSVHRWSILIIVQRDATQSSLFIILQVHSTRFGCQPHPSSGLHKTVTTASGTGHIFMHLPPSNVAKLTTLEGGILLMMLYIFWYPLILSVFLRSVLSSRHSLQVSPSKSCQ